MKLKFLTNRKIGQRLAIGFTIVAMLTIILGIIAVVGMQQLAKTTADLHEHPLAVSNALRDIQAEILSMHRSMKDVVLAKSDEELQIAIDKVDESEQEALGFFDIIFHRG